MEDDATMVNISGEPERLCDVCGLMVPEEHLVATVGNIEGSKCYTCHVRERFSRNTMPQSTLKCRSH